MTDEIQVYDISATTTIKYIRDRGDSLPPEKVECKVVEAPRDEFINAMDLLLTTVVDEIHLNDDWLDFGRVTRIQLKWWPDKKFSIEAIHARYAEEGVPTVPVKTRSISRDHIENALEDNVKKIIKHAVDYTNGKTAQLGLDLEAAKKNKAKT